MRWENYIRELKLIRKRRRVFRWRLKHDRNFRLLVEILGVPNPEQDLPICLNCGVRCGEERVEVSYDLDHNSGPTVWQFCSPHCFAEAVGREKPSGRDTSGHLSPENKNKKTSKEVGE
jgi:hypothetical protein